MKRILWLPLVFFLFTGIAWGDSVTIILKDGRRIQSSTVWEEGDQVRYKKYGSIIGIPKSKVERIVRPESEESRPASEWLEMALELKQEGVYTDPETALTYIENALRANPDLAAGFIEAGNVYLQTNEIDNAEKAYARAMELEPDNAEIYVAVARLEAQQGKFDAVISRCTQALSIDNSNAAAYELRGVAYIKQDRNIDGVLDLKKACELGNCKALHAYEKNR